MIFSRRVSILTVLPGIAVFQLAAGGVLPTANKPYTETEDKVFKRDRYLVLDSRVIEVKDNVQLTVGVAHKDKNNKQLAESELMTTTVSDAKIQWKEKFAFKELKHKEIKLKFELRESKLFSFSFEN